MPTRGGPGANRLARPQPAVYQGLLPKHKLDTGRDNAPVVARRADVKALVVPDVTRRSKS